jgi:hypothetical protein
MRRKLLLAACAGLFGLSVAFSACGGDDNNSGSNSGTSTPAATSPAGVTPFPTGQVNGNQIVSDSKGYSATIPDGWKSRFNLIQSVDGSTDAFFEPLIAGSQAQANVNITCIVDDSFTGDQYIEAQKTVTARLPLNKNVTETDITVDGIQATALRYTQASEQNPDQPTLGITDIFFTGKKCKYVLKTTAKADDVAKYQPQFDIFLNSFKFEK